MRASFPSPSQGVIHLGPVPLRAYALFIVVGIVVAIVTGERRMQAKGYRKGLVTDIAIWAVPFGIVGGRLYHVITDNQLYFRSGRRPIEALYIWHGGLGIWGAISLGALGAYIGARLSKDDVRLSDLGDSLAVGIPLAQGIGRLGNYFNQELYGRPSGLPWAVEIDPSHREARYADVATYQPTFLYELIWDFGTAGLVLWAERRFKLGLGRAFALYVATYCVGRFWIEALRIDEAHRFLGLRLNDYTAIVLFVLSVGYIIVRRPKHRGAHELSRATHVPAAAAVAAVAEPLTQIVEPEPTTPPIDPVPFTADGPFGESGSAGP